ncbi:hypothetical protein DFP72DRAFT_844678 [Ephemerocybe angulata]|uniref:Uncharacterized protein n=1 Tax=Ephemerocybe angulata TaxID=980116 RepID=A0A8H6MAH7_9AGAR|nr:hypothetical protein DFP72DRAFT_844678 [Tulosesus angulatus]
MLIVKVPLTPETLKARLLAWASTSSRYPYFKGTSKDLASWFSIVERACEENEILDIQYAEAAIVFIQGDLALVMEERRARYLEESGDSYWRWEDFKDDIRRVIVEAEKIMAESEATPLDKTKAAFARMRQEHPYIFASAGSALMISGSVVLIPALGILALNAIGFTSAGVAGVHVLQRGNGRPLFDAAIGGCYCRLCPRLGLLASATSAVGAGVASMFYGSRGSSTPDSSPTNGATDPPPPPYQGHDKPPYPADYAVYQSKKDRAGQ